jgi:hypothetical protein
MIDELKLKHLLKGKSKRVSGDEIVYIVERFPNLNKYTYNKLVKALNQGRGCNVTLCNDEMTGSGFMKSFGKVAKGVGKVAMNSGVGDLVINEAVGALPIGQNAQNLVSRVARHQAHDLTGSGFLKNAGRMGKSLGKSAVRSGVGDILIDEGLKRSGMDDDMRNKVGKISKNVTHDLAGSGFMKNAGRLGKSLGKSAVRSGVGDILIDEGLKRSGMDDDMRNKVGKISKNVTHDLAGGSVNPYLPPYTGGSLRNNYRTYNNSSNYVQPDSGAYMVDSRKLPMNDYANNMRGRGFVVH